jgi:16S rRNA processing protein RimM
MTDESDFVLIGRLRRAHGVHGELYMEPISDIPERFEGLRRVLVEREGTTVEYGVEAVRTRDSTVVVKLKGVDDRDAAERLKGADVGVRMSEIWPLPEDTYYVFDLMGSTILGEGGRKIGSVREVLNMPANDVLVVDTAGGEKLIPVVRSVIRSIDLENKRIEIEEIEGLLA